MRKPILNLIVLTAVASTFTLSPRWAEAQDAKAKATAGRLLQEGIELYKAGDFQDALARFQAAHEIYPTPKIYLNIGNVLQKLGRDADAAQAYQKFLDETEQDGSTSEDKRSIARAELDVLRGRLGSLEVQVEPAGATVTVDGRPFATLPKRDLTLAPGRHEVEAHAPGYAAKTQKVDIQVGRRSTVRLILSSAMASAALGPERAAREANAHAAYNKKIWGLVVAGIGLGMVGIGTYYGLEASSKSDELARCTQANPCTANQVMTLDDDGSRAQKLEILFLSAGGAAVIGGSLLYYWGYRQGRASTVSIAPSATGALAVWRGRF